jgi:hypothetical protein
LINAAGGGAVLPAPFSAFDPDAHKKKLLVGHLFHFTSNLTFLCKIRDFNGCNLRGIGGRILRHPVWRSSTCRVRVSNHFMGALGDKLLSSRSCLAHLLRQKMSVLF